MLVSLFHSPSEQYSGLVAACFCALAALLSLDCIGDPACAATAFVLGITSMFAGTTVPHVDMNEHGPLISHSHHTQQVDFSKRLIVLALKLEARVRIELTIEVLQTSALPLGYRAGY